jgi:hypothetical protein
MDNIKAVKIKVEIIVMKRISAKYKIFRADPYSISSNLMI